MKKNLLFITSYSGMGGGETMQLNLMRTLDRERYCLHLITPEAGTFQQEAIKLGVNAQAIPFRGTTTVFIPAVWTHFPVVARLLKYLQQEHIDAIVSDYHALPFIVPAAEALNIPIVWLCHGWWFPIYPWQRHFFQQRIQRIIAVSQAVKDGLIRKLSRFSLDRIKVVVPGLDPDSYHPDIDGSAIRARLGIGAETPLVVMVARFQSVKGHEYFLEAAQHILDAIPDARFAVAGESVFGVSRDETYKRRILQLAESDPRLRERVTYLGFIPGAYEVYAAGDVTVCSSLFESFGMAALESMSMQRPIVSTNVGGPAETIIHGVTGYLVPPKDSKQLAERIITLLQNPVLRQQMGEAGRTHIMQHFTIRNFTLSLSEVIEEITT